MNETGFSDNNDTFVGNRSVEQYYDYYCYYYYDDDEPWLDRATARTVRDVILYVVYALGIPGNILSAIVWLRRHIASENPSAIYLAALAVDDLVFLIFGGADSFIRRHGIDHNYWLSYFLVSVSGSATFLEPLLVLAFSVVRLIAIRRPLQVCYVASHFRLT